MFRSQWPLWVVLPEGDAGTAGIAGGLFAHLQSTIRPDDFKFDRSIDMVVMIIVGGLGSVTGAIAGAIFVSVTLELMRDFQQYRLVAYALMLVLIMLFRPQGAFGTHEISVLFTPWGEALIRGWYQDGLVRLTNLSHVRRAAIQTNLSCPLDWVDACDKTRLALWATYNPTEVARGRFVAKCRELHGRGVRACLDESEWAQLNSLVDRYRLFHQRFFRSASSLVADPAASVEDFARLLHSVGNRMTKEQPGDAERAYRLSLRLRPERNLAHAGLALLLEQTGRTREAADEARTALTVLDEFARRTSDGMPTTEDISPFRSPVKLREALEQVRGGRQAR